MADDSHIPESHNGDQTQGNKQRTRRFFTPGIKAKIVMDALRSGNSVQVMKDHHIHPNVFYRWRTLFIEGGTKALAGEATSALDADEVSILREQNQRLKLALGDLYLRLLDYEEARVADSSAPDTENGTSRCADILARS